MGLISRWKRAKGYGPTRKNFSSGGWSGTNLPLWHPSHPMQNLWTTNYDPAREKAENDFAGYVQEAYKQNGAVFAVAQARQMAFSEARFLYRRFEKGQPGALFGDESLGLLEHPWPGGTTGELLGRMEQDATLAGNFYAARVDDAGRYGNSARGPGLRIARLRPDWVTILVGTKSSDGSPLDLDATVLGYLYRPTFSGTNAEDFRPKQVLLMPEEVCHYSPIPDPEARFRGMSWLTPILREIDADSSATIHKGKFFANAAVPGMAIKFDKDTAEDAFDEFVESFKKEHQGNWNAYKTLFLMGGADVTPLTMDFKQMEFNATIGKGESRIAAAGGVPASWVGFSEGLQGSGLNSQGVYAAARRRFADGTIRPLWRMAAAALEVLVVPDGSDGRELWFDDRGVAFLREDARDRAEILRTDLVSIELGIRAGFEPDAVVEAAQTGDLGKLIGKHTGLVSVQMQEPGAVNGANPAAAPEPKPTDAGGA